MIIAHMHSFFCVCLCLVVESTILFDYYHHPNTSTNLFLFEMVNLEVHSVCNIECGVCDYIGLLWCSHRQIMIFLDNVRRSKIFQKSKHLYHLPSIHYSAFDDKPHSFLVILVVQWWNCIDYTKFVCAERGMMVN